MGGGQRYCWGWGDWISYYIAFVSQVWGDRVQKGRHEQMDGIRSPENSLTLSLVPAFFFDAPGIVMLGIEQGDACPTEYCGPEKDIIERRRADENIRIDAGKLGPQDWDCLRITSECIVPDIQILRYRKGRSLCRRCIGKGRYLMPSHSHFYRDTCDDFFQSTSAVYIMKIDGDTHGYFFQRLFFYDVFKNIVCFSCQICNLKLYIFCL